MSLFSKIGKSQENLREAVQSLLGSGVTALSNFRHMGLSYSSSNRVMELDVFVPSLQVAFEYQGKQHYDDNNYFSDQRTGKVSSLTLTLTLILAHSHYHSHSRS